MLFISSACVKSNNILDSIEKLQVITKNIELSGGSKESNGLFESITNLKAAKDFNFLVHNYFPPPRENFVLNFADTSLKTRDFINQSMKYVNSLDIPYYSVHAGFKRDFDIKNEILVDGVSSFKVENIKENISWYYDNFDKKIALENLYPNGQRDTCFGAHIDEIETILDFDSRVYLLLDLGHLKVASRSYGFNYLEAVTLLFEKYSDRILEIHLSENNGLLDDHNIIHTDSIQYMLVDKYKKLIKENNINLTIEARGFSLDELEICYNSLKKIIG